MTGDGTPNGKQHPPAKRLGQEPFRPPHPKRFYTSAAVEPRDGGFGIALDGRPLRTPAKRQLIVPVEALAAAIADEWQAQGERIDPATMPLTRLANTAIDAVALHMAEVGGDIVAFAGSDLLCYRAASPEALARRQAEAWDPLLAWARQDLGAGLATQIGVMPIEQPSEALQAVSAALAGLDALALAAMHVLTTMSGSAVLALALQRNRISTEEAWAAATVDDRWQAEQWGRDTEADARAALRYAEFTAAAQALRLLNSR